MILSPQDRQAIDQAAGDIGANPDWLYKLLKFESDFNPLAANPKSSARGLIQFIDRTARDLGFTSADNLVVRNPTIPLQLKNAVVPYLRQHRPFPTPQSLYMAVFYPAAKYWPVSQAFPEWVQKANPGIRTVADYVAKVEQIDPLGVARKLLILLTGIYFLYTLIKKDGGNGGAGNTQ